MTVLAIDYGRIRLGLAVSDVEEIVAQPLPQLHRHPNRRMVTELRQLITERDVGEIVVGLPRNMDGSLGEMAQEVLRFAQRLQADFRLPIETFDERLTSVEAERALREANAPRRRRKQLRDSVSAVLILQGYLEARRSTDSAARADDVCKP